MSKEELAHVKRTVRGYLIFSLLVSLLMGGGLLLVGAVTAKSTGVLATPKRALVFAQKTPPEAPRRHHRRRGDSDSSFDYKFFLQLLTIIGSVVVFAFYNGAKLGKIENRLENMEKSYNSQQNSCVEHKKDGREGRKNLWQEVRSLSDRLLKIETRMEQTGEHPIIPPPKN